MSLQRKEAYLVDEIEVRTFSDGPPFVLPKSLVDELLDVVRTKMTGNFTMNIKDGVVLSYKVERIERI